MKFSELQRLQRREGITVLSSDARIEQLEARLCTITKERDALRAKIEAMEQQEPIIAQHRFRHPHKNRPNWTDWWQCAVSERPAWEIDSQGYEVEYRKLYLAPGAQGKQK